MNYNLSYVESIKKYIGFAIGFCVLVLVIQLVGGDSLSDNFLMLVILSVVVLNSDKVISFLDKNF